MRNFFEKLFLKFLRFGLTRRYRVKVIGLEALQHKSGVLLLANHVSILDPLLVVTACWPQFKPRPVVTKRYFDLPILRNVFRFVRAIPAPDFSIGKNSYKVKELHGCYDAILEALKAKANVLFYPAGRLKIHGFERLEGTSGLMSLLERNKEIEVVLIRTTGLWGSSFSTAVHGRTPDLFSQALYCLKMAFANLLLFMPKRDVLIEFEAYKLPQNDVLKDLNSWFNKNHPEGEPLKLLPYHPFATKAPFKRIETVPTHVLASNTLVQEICQLLSEFLNESVEPKTHLLYDLNMDSLASAELYTILESKYGLIDLYSAELATPLHIAAMVEGTWESMRHQGVMARFEKKLKNRKGLFFDPFVFWVKKKEIEKRALAYSKAFKSDSRNEIPLLLPAGIDALSAFIALKSLNKTAQFSPQKGPVYTTHQMIYKGHALPSFDSLIYLSKKGKGGTALKQIDVSEEAKKLVCGQKVIINALYSKKPELALEVALLAYENEIPHIFVSSLTANCQWAYLTSSHITDGKLLI